jgi:phosphoribosylformylglycinamidine synthase PurS subunit
VKAIVHVTLKPDVLDPQGKAIQRASASLGYAAVRSVRQGKVFELELDAADEAQARALVAELSEKLLANPVIETYSIERLGEGDGA